MSLQKTNQMYQRGAKVIPYGVNSNFRYWGPDETLVIPKSKGSHIWDVDGNRYIDYRLAFGPIILGHGYDAVTERVSEAIKDGTLFAWTTPMEIRVAERITRMCKIDKVRLTNTGSEATMHALRLARAYTNREKFIKFEGQYHGQVDYFMFSTASSSINQLGSPRSPVSAVTTSGIPRDIVKYVINLPFNDLERLEETIEARWHEIAAVFVEPLLGNAAGIMPKPEFLAKLRELTAKYGIVLVFDEVKTGFRIAKGGAQEYFGIQADLVTYAKSMGNGFPIAAFGGKEDIMMTLQPGKVSHGGTYSGNVAGAAAADATLELIETQPILETIAERGQKLKDGLGQILTDAGIPHAMLGHPAIFGMILGVDTPPTDFRGYLDGDAALYEAIITELIKLGAQPDSDGREPWFMCYSHSEQDVADTLTMFEQAVKTVLDGKK